ncbi:VanZ family protein [Streptomyces sp. NPDC052040]|uniref:VanZ family protein n=1 Tax=Streptomyces sp. NPDC052040 TaxID=3365682 RepID=UPI0037D08716
MGFQSFLLIGLLGGAAVFAVATAYGRPQRPGRRVALALLCFWVVGVVYFTFGTPSGGGRALNLKPLDVTHTDDLVDAALNVLMFVPGGLLLSAFSVRRYQAALWGFTGSFAIEATQYLTESGRSADVNDLCANTVGALIGCAGVALVVDRMGPARSRTGT